MKTQVTDTTNPAHHEGGKPMGNSPSSLDPPYQLQPEQQQDATNAGPITAERPPSTAAGKNSKKLALVPLIFLIFFEVSGGPFAEEPAVAAAGPLLAIIGFLVFPFIWSIPEALITAELATAYPGNGGYVIWATKAFGPFWGSLMGSWKFLSGSINNAAYPVLCADYIKRLFPVFSSGLPRHLAIAFFTIILSFLNYTGLTVVGYTAVTLGIIALLPFLLMTGFALPKLHPHRWGSMGNKQKDWNLYFNTLFWNLNFWDNASALAGEVDRPQQTFPKALFSAGILVCLGYILPLLAATGSLDVPQDQWSSGFLADAAGMIAGRWLKIWVEVGAVLSSMGLFEAQLSTCAYQVHGMASLGFLPRFTGIRSTWFNTPWVGIAMTSAITLGVSFIGFEDIIASANFLYSLGMLLEFASFIWLRRKYPEVKRPYKVPTGMAGVVAMVLVPSGFLVYVMVIAGKIVFLISGSLTALGLVGFFFMRWCKQKGWMEFQEEEEEVEERGGGEEGGAGLVA